MHKTFTKDHFNLFQLSGLEERMNAIRKQIQPIFKDIGETYLPYIERKTGYAANVHIAQHRRRTSNPPESTWSAIGGDARGYKKYPHLQVGINEEYVFIFLSIIDNPTHEIKLGESLLNNQGNWAALSEDFVVSGDHTKSKTELLNEESILRLANRLINVKKGEILIGRIIPSNSRLLEEPHNQQNYFKETISLLSPLYKQLLDVHYNQGK